MPVPAIKNRPGKTRTRDTLSASPGDALGTRTRDTLSASPGDALSTRTRDTLSASPGDDLSTCNPPLIL